MVTMSLTLMVKGDSGRYETAPIETFTFPGGEFHVRPIGDADLDTDLVVDLRGSDSIDIMRAGVLASYCRSRGVKSHLLLPYLPAARSDHDDVMGAKVYADVINSFGFSTVVTMDPHSSVAADLYTNLVIADHTDLVKDAVSSWEKQVGGGGDKVVGIIAANKSGASHAASIAQLLGVPLYQALKHRDPDTGKLTGFSVERLPGAGKLLVVDDICDGGGTFLGLASIAGVSRERLGLWVTHGVFSGSAPTNLDEAFSFVCTTNSFPSAARYTTVVRRVDITTDLLKALEPKPDREHFLFGGTRWDITAAKEIVADGRLASSDYVDDLVLGLDMIGIDPAHAAALPDEVLDEPIIFATIENGNALMVIDGWHRIHAANERERTFINSVTLTSAESASIRSSIR